MGAHLAFACDLVVAAEEARFIEVFVRRGISPDAGGAYLLPRLVGLQKAKELIFFGDDLPAAEAARIGLVNRVVPREELIGVAGELAARLAAGPTKAIGAAKWLLNRSFESDRRTAFDEEAMAQDLVVHSVDAGEGLRAFAERRDPEFRGF
jgi:2-(1,2-epoxy-1,2-dihydrophenyl)acetyl-CoA isomerase